MRYDLHSHIYELAKRFNVRLVMDTGMKVDPTTPEQTSSAEIKLRHKQVLVEQCMVHTSYVDDERTYAIALHEFGHILSPLGCLFQHMDNDGKIPTLRNVHLLLEQEQAAWEWAQHYALQWTPEMEKIYRSAYKTYTDYCEQLIPKLKQ